MPAAWPGGQPGKALERIRTVVVEDAETAGAEQQGGNGWDAARMPGDGKPQVHH